MAINFPNSPTNGQIFTSGGKSYEYNSTTGVWNRRPEATSPIPADISDLTDTTNVIPADISDLTDTGGLLGGSGVTENKAIALSIVFGR